MKILEICPFSAGICGVWSRVKQESLELSKKGNEVYVFSSNIEKGTNKIISLYEEIQEVKIERFESNQGIADRLILSKNVTYFDFNKKLKDINPDVVITHLIHPHSFKALEICNKLKIPIFLVTHAPFNVKRKFPLNLITSFWNWRNKFRIHKFTKIISITKWEFPYLLDLGIPKEKIKYIPNGIPEEFFIQKKSKEQNKILFLGRIAPVKDLELFISLAKEFPKINFSIVGKAESSYIRRLNSLKSNNVKIYPPIYNLKEKIKLIDEHKFFILPSKREAMPQSLIEAMARGKIVISSNTDGGKEIVEDNKTGFLFKIGDKEDLKNKITKVLLMKPVKISKIKKNAKESVKKYSWRNLIKKYLTLFEK